MKKTPGLVRDKKSGIYKYRVRVPKNLISAVGRTEIKESLETTNLAEARALYPGARARADALLDQTRNTSVPAPPLSVEVSQGELQKIARDWFSPRWHATEESLWSPLPSWTSMDDLLIDLQYELGIVTSTDEHRYGEYLGLASHVK